MRNFYELDGHVFFDIKTYMQEWAKKCELASPNAAFHKTKLQSLGSMSQNLWTLFNGERNKETSAVKDKHYMETSQGLQAYLASFLLPNIERVFALLVKDENSISLKNLCAQQSEEFVIADFGSGPLSATVGLFCALEYLASTDDSFELPIKFKVYAIERSEKIFKQGLDLISKSFFNNNVVIERITSTEKLPEKIDAALCVNIFNEIPIKHRLGNLNKIVEKLSVNGTALILEPAQEVHSKNLGKLRDEFLKLKGDECQIISPCAHKNQCPLASSLVRTDWCWFRHGWNPPELLKEIEKFSKIDHHYLNFSYIYLTKNVVKTNESFYARVVSEKLQTDLSKQTTLNYFKHNIDQGEEEEFSNFAEQGDFVKLLLCAQDGELKSTLLKTTDENEYKKGMRFIKQSSLNFIFKERS